MVLVRCQWAAGGFLFPPSCKRAARGCEQHSGGDELKKKGASGKGGQAGLEIAERTYINQFRERRSTKDLPDYLLSLSDALEELSLI